MDPVITYHFVWSPMRAKPCLRGEAAERLEALIRETVRMLSIDLEDIRVYPDRVYVSVAAPPTVAPHRIVSRLKARSSHCLRHEFQEMTRIPTLWTRAYWVQAGDHLRPEQVLEAYDAVQPPRRPPGRPRSCGTRE